MSELFKWSLALVILVAVYVVIFASGSHTVSDAQSQYWINNCRLLEVNIDRGSSLPHKTGFSVVMLLKMSARLIMTAR